MKEIAIPLEIHVKVYFVTRWQNDRLQDISFSFNSTDYIHLFYPFRIKFMKIAAHAHINDLSIINLILS